MRAGGQNRGAHQRERSIVSGFAPVLPRLVSRPLTDAEDSLIPGAPDGRLSATRSDGALPIARVSHSFRVSFGRRGKRHSGRVGYTRVVQKRIWRKLIRIEVNKDRSTNLGTGRFGSVLCLSKDPVAGESSD